MESSHARWLETVIPRAAAKPLRAIEICCSGAGNLLFIAFKQQIPQAAEPFAMHFQLCGGLRDDSIYTIRHHSRYFFTYGARGEYLLRTPMRCAAAGGIPTLGVTRISAAFTSRPYRSLFTSPS
jgi:hypothetical protein